MTCFLFLTVAVNTLCDPVSLYLRDFKKKHPAPKVAIVVAMTSLRISLQNVFSKIPGLNRDMVINPSDAVNYDGIFDL